MKLKIVTIYRRADGSHSLSDFHPAHHAAPTPVNAWFLHTVCRDGQLGTREYYESKPMCSTRKETRTQCFAVPKHGATDSDKAKAEQEIRRGRHFFSRREGMLFGALVELCRFANLISIETHAN